MSMDDLSWRRSLYVAGGLATLAIAILLFFVIPYINGHEDINRGPGWVFSGIQLMITGNAFFTGISE